MRGLAEPAVLGVKAPVKGQLLKWIGNKQKMAMEICSAFPERFGRYHEPFLGSGAVLGTLRPSRGLGSDKLQPLIDLMIAVRDSPSLVKRWYMEDSSEARGEARKGFYEAVRASYNDSPNPRGLLFISRAGYGGVIRFRQRDGWISTPCGTHRLLPCEKFDLRVDDWSRRLQGTEFACMDYKAALSQANPGDLVYCDPPYQHSQSILYGSQQFDFQEFLDVVSWLKRRGVFVALSIDGTKRSGKTKCHLDIPVGLFEQELWVQVGKSMMRRFQLQGGSMNDEKVADRLLLTYSKF